MQPNLFAACRTWLKYAELRRRKAARLSAARTALSNLQLARLLPAWQEVTAQQQHKHQQAQQAQQHYYCQLQRRMLAVWQDNAAEAVVERLQLTAAAELHRLRLLSTGLKGLAWYPRWVLILAVRTTVLSCLQMIVLLTDVPILCNFIAFARPSSNPSKAVTRHAIVPSAKFQDFGCAAVCCRYVQLKAAAPEHYQHRLVVRALIAWRDRTAAKQHAEQQRRLAVRHQYLCTLGKVLQAWQEAVSIAGGKQQASAAAQQHFERKLLTAVLQVRVCCINCQQPGFGSYLTLSSHQLRLAAHARQACQCNTHTTGAIPPFASQRVVRAAVCHLCSTGVVLSCST